MEVCAWEDIGSFLILSLAVWWASEAHFDLCFSKEYWGYIVTRSIAELSYDTGMTWSNDIAILHKSKGTGNTSFQPLLIAPFQNVTSWRASGKLKFSLLSCIWNFPASTCIVLFQANASHAHFNFANCKCLHAKKAADFSLNMGSLSPIFCNRKKKTFFCRPFLLHEVQGDSKRIIKGHRRRDPLFNNSCDLCWTDSLNTHFQSLHGASEWACARVG